MPSTAGWHLPHLGRVGLGDADDWKDTLWLLLLLALALVIGLGCAALATAATLRAPLLPALHRE